MMRRRVEGKSGTATIRQMKSSRIEVDHFGFRLVNHGQPRYYIDVPAPPQAPEPYKITAASSSMIRAHRRSSFVILAEGGQITSRSVGGSPTHDRIARSALSPNRTIHERSSPFKPRGFRGPLPHAQSRPPSPVPSNQRRFIQPKSLSQGCSPKKKSSIPQLSLGFTGNTVKGMTISDHDRWEHRSGRRLTTKIPRSNSLRVSITNRVTDSKIRDIKKPSMKLATNNFNETSVSAAAGKKLNRSPTKIPIRHVPSGRFIQLINVQQNKNEAEMVASTLPTNSALLPTIPVSIEPATTDKATPLSLNDSQPTVSMNGDPGCVYLHKQTSGESGKSASVVSGTTTTTVHTLIIDGARISPQDAPDLQHVEKQGDSISKTDTAETRVEASVNQRIPEDPTNGMQRKSESTEIISPLVTPMNVEAVIETVENASMRDTLEAKNKKDPKGEVKVDFQLEIETKAIPLKNNEKLEKPNVDLRCTHTLMMDPLTKKHTSNPPDILNVNSSIETLHRSQNHGSEISLKSSNGVSMGSGESLRSTDTGVSLNTVRGVSSAREKRGTHVVKKSQNIETLSGNVMNSENRYNGEPAIVEMTESTTGVNQSAENKQPKMRNGKFLNWRNSFVRRFRDCWLRTYKNHEKTIFSWKKKTEISMQGSQQFNLQMRQPITKSPRPTENICSQIKAACCRSNVWRSKTVPKETSSCCRAERNRELLYKSSRDWCRWSRCCCSCRRESDRNRSIRAKHSLTSVVPPPLSEEQKSRIPDVLIEHNSVMRGAIPCLPVPLAWFCFIWNVIIPGSGTLWSGLFNLCIGQPRFSVTASAKSRFGALIINIIVSASQFFTVLFCLVGWGWSIWWGVTMVRLARKWKRFKAAEVSNGDSEARGNEGIPSAPGVSTQTVHGVERPR